jgi:hypothetical protein
MANRLLDRQIALLEYLTSAATLFGEEVDSPVDPVLRGIDKGLLRLEARFCCNKRIKKIIAAFPRTLEMIGADQGKVLREFVEANQQRDINSLTNARQFYEFLLLRSQSEQPKLAYLLEVAACEFSIIKNRNIGEDI